MCNKSSIFLHINLIHHTKLSTKQSIHDIFSFISPSSNYPYIKNNFIFSCRYKMDSEQIEELYDSLVEIEDKLENNLPIMERIRLERQLKFINQRIDEYENYQLNNADLIRQQIEDEQIRLQEEKIRQEEERLRMLKIEKYLRAFDDTINRSAVGDISMVLMMVSSMVRKTEEILPLIEYDENILNMTRAKAADVLEAINNNTYLSFNANKSNIHTKIIDQVKKMFHMLGMQDIEIQYDMNTADDEAYARMLQEKINRSSQEEEEEDDDEAYTRMIQEKMYR